MLSTTSLSSLPSSSKIITVPKLSAYEAETILDLCSPPTPFLDYPCSLRELLSQLYRGDLGEEARRSQSFSSFAKTMEKEITRHYTPGEDYVTAGSLYYWKIRSMIHLLQYLADHHQIGQRMLQLLNRIDTCIEYRVTDIHAATILSRNQVPEHYLQLTRRLFLMEFLLIWKSDLDDLCKYPVRPILIK